MRLPLTNLDRRYSKLRIRDAVRRSRMLESLEAHDQQVPVAVVASAEAPEERYVLIDGYLRVDSLENSLKDIETCLEEADARLENTDGDLATESGRTLDSSHRESSGDIAQRSQTGTS